MRDPMNRGLKVYDVLFVKPLNVYVTMRDPMNRGLKVIKDWMPEPEKAA